jgi:NTF2 fold immunity protein
MSGLDIVPDGETALQIGKIILKGYYGEKLVNAYEPYEAVLHGEEWWVSGSSPDPCRGKYALGGGMPQLSMSKKDARVLLIALSK